jgi:hypothetical protein
VPFGLVLLTTSVAAFGIRPWLDFVLWTVPFHARLIGDFHIEAMPTIVSVYAAAGMLGAPVWLAQLIQYTFSAIVLWRAIALLRREGPNALTITIVLLSALMALPYVNSYDLAIAAPALSVALLQDRDGSPLLPLVSAVILWLIPAFALPLGLAGLPIAPLCVAGILGFAILRTGSFRQAGFSASPIPRTVP